MTLFDKYGPWAVITGASEGTGQAFARRVTSEGLPCVLLARRLEPLERLAASIKADTGVECVVATADLAAPDGADQVLAAVGDREVGLYIANAGADSNSSHFLDAKISAWLELVRLNVMTMMQLTHYFGGAMRDRRRGGIILVNSGAAYGGGSFMAAYTASKAFELNFGESLWAELRPYGVDVLNLVLGKTNTPAFRAVLDANGLPYPTDWATPEQVAESGITRLALGPIHNQGQSEDVAADQRRTRVLKMDEMTQDVFGNGSASPNRG
jgi:short-subunit dehydrogenase